MVFRLDPHVGDDGVWLHDIGIDDHYQYDLLEGKKVGKIDMSKFELKFKSKKYKDCLGSSIFFFVNKKIKQVLEEFVTEQKINFIPVKVNKKFDYWLINLIGTRDCMDKERSVFSTFKSGSPDKITQLVFQESLIHEYDLFRLKDKEINLFITKKLLEKLEEVGITGIQYHDNMDLTFG